jgi:hypothetical protein
MEKRPRFGRNRPKRGRFSMQEGTDGMAGFHMDVYPPVPGIIQENN